MFTGIIAEVGSVAALTRRGGGIELAVRAATASAEMNVDDSIAVNGVCQTVIAVDGDVLRVEAVEETLKKTTLGRLRTGSPVNIELPVRLNDRLGGHLVQGHVDCVGTVARVAKQSMSWLLDIEYPPEFSKYLIPVGSIAVDGISLTVAALKGSTFTVSIIPHTLEWTTLGGAEPGMEVNLEFDMIGKYIERLLQSGGTGGGGITPDRLTQWGYGT